MAEKSIALRLADALKIAVAQSDADDDVILVARWFVEDAAAELRRLHTLNSELLAAAKEAEPLLQAMLDNIRNTLPQYQKMPALDNLRAAIARAEDLGNN